MGPELDHILNFFFQVFAWAPVLGSRFGPKSGSLLLPAEVLQADLRRTSVFFRPTPNGSRQVVNKPEIQLHFANSAN